MHRALVSALAVVSALSFVGCVGEAPAPAKVSDGDRPPADLLAESWMLKGADDETRAPFETSAGWISIITRRDLPTAVRDLGKQGGLPAARAHADAAAMYRQAALVTAHSLVQTYGHSPREGDPIGVAHLLTVSHLILDDADKAKASALVLADVEGDPTSAWHTAWADASWPVDVSKIPVSLDGEAGDWPHLGNPPQYQLPEQTDDGRLVAMGDPGALVAAALWHEKIARQEAGDQAALVDAYGARYLMPIEAVPALAGPLPMEFIFGSDVLHPNDADFLVAVQTQGIDAVDAWADESLLASLSKLSIVDGKIDAERAREVSQTLRRVVKDDMAEVAGSSEDFHRTFADIARVSTLRGLAEVARASDDRYTEGVLRISALDHSASMATADMPWLLSMCAYDAGNRFPSRPNELLHNMIKRVPELETARYGLDVLALRVSRESGAGQLPGM